MIETITAKLPLACWRGDRGTYHGVIFLGEPAKQISTYSRLYRLEFGTQRGFGSVKVIARVGNTDWKTSVFPQKSSAQWILLVSKKVMAAEHLTPGWEINVSLDLI